MGVIYLMILFCCWGKSLHSFFSVKSCSETLGQRRFKEKVIIKVSQQSHLFPEFLDLCGEFLTMPGVKVSL